MGIIKDLIPLLPDLLRVFIPGLLFFQLYNWLNSKKMTMGILTLWSLVVGYIINISFDKISGGIISDDTIRTILYYLIAIILAVIVDRIVNAKWFGTLLHNYNSKVVYHSAFDYFLDYKLGTALEVKLKNCPYYYLGSFKYREEKEGDAWLGLSQYYKLDCATNNIIDSYENDVGTSVILVNLRDVENIKMIYEDESECLERINR